MNILVLSKSDQTWKETIRIEPLIEVGDSFNVKGYSLPFIALEIRDRYSRYDQIVYV